MIKCKGLQPRVTKEHARDYLEKLDAFKAAGQMGCMPRVLKELIEVISKPLSIL